MRPGLLGYTINNYKMNKVLGVSNFRLVMVTEAIKIAALLLSVKLASEAI